MEDFKVTQTGDEIQEILNQSPLDTANIAELEERLSDVEGKIPSEASDENQLADKEYVDDSISDTADELTALINEKANAADVYTKSETYNKTELDNMITTPDVQYVSVTATAQTTAVTDVLPATGAADTLYRVGSWDGTQYDANSYSEYAWDGTSYVPMSVKDAGIATGSDFDNPTAAQRGLLTTVGAVLDGCDATPTAGSMKPVQSGGVYQRSVMPLYRINADIENYAELELGTINNSGVLVNSNTRARTLGYISSPFSITTDSSYKVYYVYKYNFGQDGTITFVGSQRINNSTFATEDNYIYKIVFSKKTDGVIDNSELKDIILTFKGKNTTIEEDFANSLSELNADVSSLGASVTRFQSKFDIFDTETIEEYNYQWTQGGISAVGAESSDSNRIKTGTYFYSEEGSEIHISNKDGFLVRLFTYSGTGGQSDFEDWGRLNSDTFNAVAGKYYRFVLLKSDDADITPNEGKSFKVTGFDNEMTSKEVFSRPVYPEDIENIDVIINKNLIGQPVAFLGDSITQQSSATSQSKTYHGVFCSLYGAIDRTIQIHDDPEWDTDKWLGINATCIANNTKNNKGNVRFVTRVTSENLNGCKLIVVFGGTNDLSYDSEPIGDLFVEETIAATGNMGTKHLAAPTNTDTFAGALHNLIQTIQTVAPGVPIVFMTPLKRDHNTASNPDYLTCNSNGDFMIDFVNAIKEICAFYSIPVLDLYSNSQLNPLAPGWSTLFGDGLHPNNKGHEIIGNLLFRFVEQNVVI